MELFPLGLLHKEEATETCDSTSLPDVPHVSTETKFPMEKWIHIGCQVSSDLMRLHIDGEIVGEKAMSLLNKESISSDLTKFILVCGGGDDNSLQGYVHSHKVLPVTSSISEYHAKDPPLQLSINNSSASEIEEGGDGVWSIVGGKASCHRNFLLDVVLLDAFSHPINKDLEVFASLVYADNGAPVEKKSDGEAPLLASHDGIEFASYDRPSKMLYGHVSLKLKISQLSSKCDNRMFRIMFHMPKLDKYPFLKAFTPPIRCISRNRITLISSILSKRPASAIDPLNLSQLSGLDDEALELQHSSVYKEKPSPSSKRSRLGQDRIPATVSSMEQPDDECNSHARTAHQVKNAFATNGVGRPDSLEELDDSQTDSENAEARNSALKSTSSSKNSMSDSTIFKYCLAGLAEKPLLLQEIASTASDEELLSFGHEVSLYSGCSHHRHQIEMAKRLMEEGTKAWNSISQKNHQVPWESAVFEIEEQFMRIASCTSRSLTQLDFELLKRIAGCRDYLAQENFKKMWCWLYPVALTLSRDWINTMWSSTSPKWIEGFITKEEAQASLQGSRGFQEPGTFVLRFPTSRSWPHPDAGSLVVAYVGSKHTVHHKLIPLASMVSSADRKPLQDMLLAEPELSQLGRIIRSC